MPGVIQPKRDHLIRQLIQLLNQMNAVTQLGHAPLLEVSCVVDSTSVDPDLQGRAVIVYAGGLSTAAADVAGLGHALVIALPAAAAEGFLCAEESDGACAYSDGARPFVRRIPLPQRRMEA